MGFLSSISISVPLCRRCCALAVALKQARMVARTAVDIMKKIAVRAKVPRRMCLVCGLKRGKWASGEADLVSGLASGEAGLVSLDSREVSVEASVVLCSAMVVVVAVVVGVAGVPVASVLEGAVAEVIVAVLGVVGLVVVGGAIEVSVVVGGAIEVLVVVGGAIEVLVVVGVVVLVGVTEMVVLAGAREVSRLLGTATQSICLLCRSPGRSKVILSSVCGGPQFWETHGVTASARVAALGVEGENTTVEVRPEVTTTIEK